MLSLYKYHDLERYLPDKLMYIDYDYKGSYRLLRGEYDGHNYGGYTIESANVGGLMIPIYYNDYNIINKTYCIEQENIDTYLNEIQNTILQMADNDIGFFRLYTRNVDEVYSKLSNDIYHDATSVVCDLYNKCISQAAARDDYNNQDPHIKIRLAKIKHATVIITDMFDYKNRSDAFLTVGLTPILFKDVAEKLNETELKYFETLVRRSQLKRISNVEVEEMYTSLLLMDKYTDKIKDIKFKSFLDNIAQVRISNAERQVRRSEDEAERYLQGYTSSKEKYYAAVEELERLKGGEAAIRESLTEAIAIDGVVDYNVTGSSTIEEMIVAPLVFYSEDDAEIIIKNKEDSFAKRLLEKLFIKQEYKMYVGNRYYFSYNQSDNFNKPYAFNGSEWDKYNALFNPHIHFYSCLGSYEPELRNTFAKKDLLMYNNLAIASTKSINFADGAVMNNWFSYINRQYRDYGLEAGYFTVKALEDNEGNRFSIKDIMEGVIEDEETIN